MNIKLYFLAELKQIPFYPDFSNWRITLNREFPIHIIVSNGLFCTNFTYRGLYNPNPWSDKKLQGSSKPTAPSRGRPRSAPARTGAPLHRAHRWNLQNNMNLFCLNGIFWKFWNFLITLCFCSCGSLKSRQGVGSGFWDILSDKSAPITILSQREVKTGSGVPKPGELTLTLTSVSAPLSLLHLQSGTSRSASAFPHYHQNTETCKVLWELSFTVLARSTFTLLLLEDASLC